MKRILLSAFFLFCLTSSSLFGQCGNLYIGGVIDGPLTGGTPKGIQICASGDVADLSIYGLGSANNGGGTDGEEFTFPAEMVSSGDCFWVGSNETNWVAWFGFTPCYTDGAANINGDDAIELFCSGAVEDLYGDINADGNGTCWEYLDGWAVNNNGGPNFGTFDCADYTFSGANELDGESSNATADTPYPSPAQTCPSLLPITLKSFEAKLRNSEIELSWTTSEEINNDYFEILRSSNGVDFKVVGKVNGYGDTSREVEYLFIDESPSNGMNYYKLNQVDLDGRSESFDIVMVENRINTVRIYPTTSAGIINVEMEDIESAKLTVMNSVGETFKVATLNSSFNSFDISELPNGIYYIKIDSNTQMFVEKIVKY